MIFPQQQTRISAEERKPCQNLDPCIFNDKNTKYINFQFPPVSFVDINITRLRFHEQILSYVENIQYMRFQVHGGGGGCIKMTAFWYIAPCNSLKKTDVSEVRIITKPIIPLKRRSASRRVHGVTSLKAIIFNIQYVLTSSANYSYVYGGHYL
jgi:hypothetical protein